jgi:hypothetical protein
MNEDKNSSKLSCDKTNQNRIDPLIHHPNIESNSTSDDLGEKNVNTQAFKTYDDTTYDKLKYLKGIELFDNVILKNGITNEYYRLEIIKNRKGLLFKQSSGVSTETVGLLYGNIRDIILQSSSKKPNMSQIAIVTITDTMIFSIEDTAIESFLKFIIPLKKIIAYTEKDNNKKPQVAIAKSQSVFAIELNNNDVVEADRKTLKFSNQRNFQVSQLADAKLRAFNYLMDLAIIYSASLFLAQLLEISAYLTYICLHLIYYSLFEYINGKTIGKYITGTIVISDNGNRLEFHRAIIRSLCRLIPLEPLSCLISEKAYGWHDSLTNTIVIPESEL